MFIERWLSDEQLLRYRNWKESVRVTFRLWIEMFDLCLKDRSFHRMFDVDFLPVFLCGVSGSGTTLLSSLLDQNYVNEASIHESARHPLASRLLWMRKAEKHNDLSEYVDRMYRANDLPVNGVRRSVLSLYRRLATYPRTSRVIFDKAPNAHLARIGHLKKAFSDSKVVLIYRDPVEVIEGMRRKWPVPFGQATVEALCEFWVALHRDFLQAARLFRSDVVMLPYAELVNFPEQSLQKIADLVSLEQRNEPKYLQDQANEPGKGLRNVIGGKVSIVKNAFNQVQLKLEESEVQVIRNKTAAMLAELNELAKKNLE
jgi:hypothetical protein